MQKENIVGRDTHMDVLSAQLKDYLLHCRQFRAHAPARMLFSSSHDTNAFCRSPIECAVPMQQMETFL